ncbi:helicase-exonuclease AddAB subunit AddB [Pelosinus sp. sgz500959]|uniref:helicase-exonuclease AddAB subunit AddB n=1 Tax=Pelosinus sp. sgz500959 TaxID=3242472 RepID=UPI00366E072C
MKLRLIIGRAGSGKTHYCLQEMGEILKTSSEGKSLVMILPEHATFQVEHALATMPGIEGFTRAYVFGFRRLAHRILMETGGAVRPHITELGKRLVLSQLLHEHQQEFKIFHRAAGQRTFADLLISMIQEFKSYGVSPELLSEAEEQLSGLTIGDKLHDLALVYQGFEKFLQGRYTDPEDYLTLLAEKMDKSEILNGAQVWIDGFTWFNPQEAAVVKKLLETSASVTMTLCLDGHSEQQHNPTALFHRQWDTRRKLVDLAKNMGVEVEEIVLTESERFTAPLLRHIEKQFFTSPAVVWTGEIQGLAVVEAANRRVEVEGMARDILRLCREEGYRWRDIGILLRDTESYADIVEIVLADYEIPFFSDRKRHPFHHPLAELLRSVLDIVIERWSYEPLFRCFKTDLLTLSRDEVDRLENYVLEFGIRGTKWTNDQTWTFIRRFSLGEDSEMSEVEQSYLQEINEIRMKASTPLIQFEQQIKMSSTVVEMTTSLYQLLEILGVPEKLEEWADRAEKAGELEQAREHRQLWDSVVLLFEQLVEVCGEQEMALKDYRDMIHEGLEGLTLSLIPPGLDYVTVSSMDQTSLENIPGIYVLGVNDGVLPMRGRGEGLLTDAERGQMIQFGLELAPGSQADSFAERFLVYTGLTRAKEYLWLSYPLADEEGKGLSPSLLIKRLRELSPMPLQSLPVEPILGTERQYLAHGKRSISALATVLRGYKRGEPVAEVWWDVYNWARQQEGLSSYVEQAVAGLFHHNQVERLPKALANRLYPKNNKLRGSVTRFESFQACPFKHFAQYGLSLKERAVFRLQAPDWGQFLHAALKNFGDRMAEEGRDWGSVSTQECHDIVNTVVEELAPKLQNEILLSSEQHKHLVGRLKRTVARSVRRLVEFDQVSVFKPMAMEKSFGRGSDALAPLVYMLPDEVGLEIVGQIDRLDTAEHEGKKYMLVIDYKSGGAWLKLVDVYYGLRLQLLTYLLVARNSYQECLPAGVLYFFLKNPSISDIVRIDANEITKKINSLLKMPGWVLADPEVIRLLDSAIDGYSEFLKIALKKDESFYSASLPYVKTPEEFALLLNHVEKKLIETACNIMDGEIEISPYALDKRTPCTFCQYHAVCQFDNLLPENEYRRLGKPEDALIIKKLIEDQEEGNHGLV